MFVKEKTVRTLSLACLYIIISAAAFILSYYIRFDGAIPEHFLYQLKMVIGWAIAIQAVVLVAMGQTRVVISYFSLVDLKSIIILNLVSCLVLFSSAAWLGGRIPRGVVILDFLLLTGGIGGARIAMRYWFEWRGIASEGGRSFAETRPVAVVGAGDAGARLVRELLSRPTLRWKPMAFFDDDPLKWGQRLHGVPIVGKPELIREDPWRSRFRKIIVAAPSAKPSRVGEIARMAADLGITSDTLPAIDQLVDGTVKLSQLRPVRIDDLLRRQSIPLDHGLIHTGLRNKVVAVTGAGGSIGSELCRQILRAGPLQLLLIERSEVQLFQIEQELLDMHGGSTIVPLIADITDPGRIREIFFRYHPQVVYHAAAHKHVPMMESQPAEAIRNNALGTASLAKLAHEYGVLKFVLISTDKAINPTNVMGASKRLAEMFLQAFQAANPGPTRFMAVRFGNVLGSSGSVVSTFRKQIAAGGPVTVTHPDVTRYFMTIPEAVGLVLQAEALGKGGEIFVLDMGDPVKIIDLARQMIELSGYRPGDEIEVRFVGLRPGEKMYEELSHHREKMTDTTHPKIFRFISTPLPLEKVENDFGRLQNRLVGGQPADLKCLVRELVPEYQPFLG
jgi:FlaA1/EpsC-like NDP-sugar epimerase